MYIHVIIFCFEHNTIGNHHRLHTACGGSVRAGLPYKAVPHLPAVPGAVPWVEGRRASGNAQRSCVEGTSSSFEGCMQHNYYDVTDVM